MNAQDQGARRRLTTVLFGAVGLASTGYIAAITVSTLAGRALTGSATLAGLPSAVAVVGTAAGASVLGSWAARRGWRPVLLGGFALAALAGAVSAAAVAVGSFALLLVGMALLGFGRAASQLARYTAADMAVEERRGTAVSLIVWAGTIGAVVGPSLLDPAGNLARSMGRSEYAGGYLVTAAFMAVAFLLQLVALRPDPASLAVGEPGRPLGERGDRVRLGPLFRLPQVQVAMAGMIAGQVVMVLIMTGTPIHIEDAGRGLQTVGLVISAHTLGMFAVSPLTGRLVDLWGRVPMLVAAFVVLAISALLAPATPDGTTALLTAALFLLGLGWNMAFVTGSSLLTSGIPRTVRAALQGRVDSMVWLSGAAASLASGAVLAGPGYTALSILGVALLVVPVGVLARRGRQAAAA